MSVPKQENIRINEKADKFAKKRITLDLIQAKRDQKFFLYTKKRPLHERADRCKFQAEEFTFQQNTSVDLTVI